ncbi:MAG: T9SS type A sorting domain-containing protein [Agriterribacter sp.]
MYRHYSFHKKIKTAFLIVCAVFYSGLLFSQTQTQTKKYVNGSGEPQITNASQIRGYWESLPVDYTTDTSKKYPLIIFWHGSGEQLPSSTRSDALDAVANLALPEYIKNGQFPNSFTVDGKTSSFIVLSPQYSTYTNYTTFIPAMVNYAVANYRVDTTRIYLTGLSLGGLISWRTISLSSTFTNKIAAEVLVCAGQLDGIYNSPSAAAVATPAAANMAIWGLNNTDDALAKKDSLLSLQNYYNAYTPKPVPPFKVKIFTGAEQTSSSSMHDAWTRSYNPAIKPDGQLNIYEWMLQYTNKKLVANAGPDQAITFPGNSTITLDGNKSTARQGRITAWLWTKISGPSAGTITHTTDSLTTVTGIDTGSYRFELKVTHTDGTTARDTVLVSTQTQTKITKRIYKLSVPDTVVIGGYLQSLPVNYDIDTAKKYPLLIFLHAVEEMGNGSQAKLDTVTKRGIPKLIREGKFPASLNVNGKDFSFIVISPQFNTTAGSNTAVQAMIDTCKKLYRVDTTRIYVTGMSQGGIIGWFYIGDIGASKTAASLLVRPTHATPLVMGTGRVANVQSANLPIWVSSNYNDPVSYTSRSNMKLFVDSINLNTPPNPAAKLTILDTSGAASTDAWTKTFNPLTKFWISTDSLNVYQWMLKYTRPQGLPRKSQPVVDTPVVKQDDLKMLDAVLTPNPVRSNVTIWITGKAKGKASITLYSLQGQRLSQQQFIKNTDEKMSRTLNVSHFSGGTYVVQVIVGNKHKRVLQFIKL